MQRGAHPHGPILGYRLMGNQLKLLVCSSSHQDALRALLQANIKRKSNVYSVLGLVCVLRARDLSILVGPPLGKGEKSTKGEAQRGIFRPPTP